MSYVNGGLEHVLVDVGGRHEGLAWCEICGAAEGELLSFCPGFKLTAEAREACFSGNVVDMAGWVRFRRMRRQGGSL